jgi:methyltransferase (TIGR00027 family)
VGVQYFTRFIDNQVYADDGDGNARMAGMTNILIAHTRFFDQVLADVGRAGIRQVVILASGLDTGPYRLWWRPGTTAYEIDQPGVIEFKAEALRGLGAEVTANRA